MWALRAKAMGSEDADPWLEFFLLRPEMRTASVHRPCTGRTLRMHPLDPAVMRHPAFVVLSAIAQVDP